MFKELKDDLFLFKLFALIISIVGGIYIFQLAWGIVSYFSDIILYLILAWILSFVLEPSTAKVMRLGLSRTASAIIIYVVLALLIGTFFVLLLPVVISQITVITQNVPTYLSSLSISQSLSLKIQDLITTLLSNSLIWISSVASFLFSLFVVLFMSFYFLIERREILSFMGRFVPLRLKDELRFVSWAVASSFAAFIRVQAILGLISGIATWVVLLVLGVNFSLSAGVLAGIFTAIPVVGPFLALIPPLLVSADKGVEIIAATVSILLILQFVEFNILAPKIWGSILRIHPAVIFLSFLVGYKIAGGWGSFFAIPVVAVLFIVGEPLLKHFWEKRNELRV